MLKMPAYDPLSAPTLPLTLVTPVLNGARYIASALESVSSQALRPIEHFVYDAGSTDGTAEIVRQFPHCTLVQEPDNGAHEAMNKGLMRAKGQFIAYLNADDRYLPNAFEAVEEVLRTEPIPNMILMGSEVRRIDDKNKNHTTLLIDRPALPGMAADLVQLTLGVPSLNARIFRTEALRQIGGFDNKFYVSADRLAILTLALGDGAALEVPFCGFQYGVHPGSQTLSPSGRIVRKIIDEHIGIADRLLAMPGLTSGQRQILLDWRSFEALRRQVVQSLDPERIAISDTSILRGALCSPRVLPAFLRTAFRKIWLRQGERRGAGAKATLMK